MCHSNIERGTFQIAQMVLNNTKYLLHKQRIIKTLDRKSRSFQLPINISPETIPIIKYTFPIYQLEPIV